MSKQILKYVPGAMIAEQEDILQNGRAFRFKTAPVDPSDPFRGKYITLDFEASAFRHDGDEKWERGKKVFVVVSEDSRGFAKVKDVTEILPDPVADYLEAEFAHSDPGIVRINYPFDRFYLEESKASEAEKVYWEANRADSAQVAYAVVRIKHGKAALEDVMINDRSIVDIAQELNADQN